MNMNDVKSMAKDLGITRTVGVKKADLIRAIQEKEGNFPCFATATDFCDQLNCSFREDCLDNA